MAKSKLVGTEQFHIIIRGSVPAALAARPKQELIAYLVSQVSVNAGFIEIIEGMDIVFGEQSPASPPPN